MMVDDFDPSVAVSEEIHDVVFRRIVEVLEYVLVPALEQAVCWSYMS